MYIYIYLYVYVGAREKVFSKVSSVAKIHILSIAESTFDNVYIRALWS